MEHGDENEDPNPELHFAYECVHFDIKPENGIDIHLPP